MSKKCILSIDEGTTGVTVVAIDKQGTIKGKGYQEFPQYYPRPGWVEHDAVEIISATREALGACLDSNKISAKEIESIGITNQRETIVLWDRDTSTPVHKAIVWQCRRTTERCSLLKSEGKESFIRERTGLLLDPYFSGSKLEWLFDSQPAWLEQAHQGKLVCGTMDSWLLWNLTGSKVHATDYTNASRTLLFNITSHVWDKELCALFKVPLQILPAVCPSAHSFGTTKGFAPLPDGIPITGMAGDQQAALFGQCCFKNGQAKNTYGTGCFIMVPTEDNVHSNNSGLLTTLACGADLQPMYALEGSVFIGGAVIQWLRDELQFFADARDSETYASRVTSTEGVYCVPAFVGLGAPYWDPDARGALVGLTRGTNQNHITRAALESIAFQSNDVLELMEKVTGDKLKELRVDGGASQNNLLLQIQADIMDLPISRPTIIESTALGAGFLAGVYSGFWRDAAECQDYRKEDVVIKPKMNSKTRSSMIEGWKHAVSLVRTT